MRWRLGVLVAILIGGIFWVFRDTKMTRDKVSVVMTGFEDEAKPILAEIKNRKDEKDFYQCEQVISGKLYDQDVLVAVSGMGKVKTAACTAQILERKENQISELIFAGIAGVSRGKGQMGDICINYRAFDFDLQHISFDWPATSEAVPQYWEMSKAFDGSKKAEGSKSLAQEIMATAKFDRVWPMDECMEATSDSFWHDSRLDKKAREMGANWLGKNPDEVVIFTSMEAVAAGLAASNKVPFAYVRSASNFDMPETDAKGTPLVSGRESLEQRSGEDTTIAIQRAAQVILNFYKTRYENI